MNWLKRMLLEKWLGRVIVLFLAWLSGWLASAGVPPEVLADWKVLTTKILEIVLPILLAWLLGKIRFSRALNTLPPGR